ncbi:hypothetical protein Clacol_002272 [Clathrus columnatus]|uniref:Uncharacterized protein n=1 Tax=Clathrus columnatus TaxID=1419009 RepID=A0AAV5A836_9AGAM|nr:hypothetical protein Clacol_002272 [Clathrus columnatus]
MSYSAFPIYSPPQNDHYRAPISSKGYPRPSFDDTFSALVNANKSLPNEKRLPPEILLLINGEVHMLDPECAELRSKWTPFAQSIDLCLYVEQLCVGFDQDRNTFSVSEEYNGRTPEEWEICFAVSSADLLYRLRCLFPEVLIQTENAGNSVITWKAELQHNQSGVVLVFSEHKTWVEVFKEEREVGDVFIKDTVRLLNMLFGTVNGKLFSYYHPAAYRHRPTSDRHYLSVPTHDIDRSYYPWSPLPISVRDMTSGTFKSLLSRLRYNPRSRKVDLKNGTANLTTIMSSALLFYRLLCHWTINFCNINARHSIASVWQVKLLHYKRRVSLLFLDDRGLFDIRVEGDENEVLDDIVSLVTALFSDDYRHPFSLIAGFFNIMY